MNDDPPEMAVSDSEERLTGRALPEREGRVRWLLIGGFALMIILLGADGIIGFRRIISVRESVSSLMETQFRNVVLIDEVQRVQSLLGSLLYRLAAGDAARDRDNLEAGVNKIEESFKALFAGIPANDPDIELWRAVEAASAEATREADLLLDRKTIGRQDLGRVLAARERVITSTSALIRANHSRAEETRRQIEEVTTKQISQDAILLSMCLLLAGLCAWLVLRTAAKLQRHITAHAAELGRVSWQLMERQENLARRLSHELHDELGQSLTALKTNFSRFTNPQAVDAKWMEDCTTLLKESIRSAHEISQLLRPTILDDFGLDSALRWLCERFEERNRIEVRYWSNLEARLDPQTETHVFRIAQEALTNIAKHANATRVEMSLLLLSDGDIRLSIHDNGVGMSPDARRDGLHFGVTGMRARARSMEGTMRLHSEAGNGTELAVTFPWKGMVHEEENAHPVSG